jgi:hypothetical protein
MYIGDKGMAEKGDIEKPSLAIRIFGPFIFIIGSIGTLWSFFHVAFHLHESLLSEIIEFDKGAFYLLGAGIGMIVLAIITVQVFWFDRPLSRRQNVYFTRVILASIVLMLALPQIVHYSMNNYITKHGYSICQAASHQWLQNRTIIYIQPTIECKKDIAELFTYKPQVTPEDFRKK